MKITIKSLCYIMLGGLFMLGGCTSEDASHKIKLSVLKEGEHFTASFGIDAEILKEKALRTGGIEDIKDVTSLRVLVFDEKGNFLYSIVKMQLLGKERVCWGCPIMIFCRISVKMGLPTSRNLRYSW